MLILGRRKDETIVLTTPAGERITIVVQDIRGALVRLGIDAPQRVTILRGELENNDCGRLAEKTAEGKRSIEQ
jgi:carbon storage regulator CsrA